MPDRTQKLVALRSRTDHDLLILIDRELDRGLALAEVASSKTSPLFEQGQKALRTAATLSLRICAASDSDWLRIEAKLRDLRSQLDGVPAYASARPFPASVAS